MLRHSALHARQLLYQALPACSHTLLSGSCLLGTTKTSSRQFSSAAGSSSRKADVVIVGAGHNGLVAALLLAKQGLKVGTCTAGMRCTAHMRTDTPAT